MAIVQISKIQHRTGNLIDLPQLSDAELGWASDANRLFIGTTPPQNIEVLTSYSSISFSQIDGSSNANLNLSNVVNGQILAYDSSTVTWTNKGGNASDPGNSAYFSNTNIHLGNVSNVKIGGGVNGYVLQTDGSGNLSWIAQTGGGGGSGVPGGANTQVQFNDGTGNFGGNPNLTFDGTVLTVTGNILATVANVGNLNATSNVTASRLISNVATGTAPLIVTSTTQVANLSVATAGSATTAGTVTTAAQPNITSVGTLTGLSFANASTLSGNNFTLTTGANTNAGTITGNWSLSAGSQLRATYADLAEYYEADQMYEPGTILEFGGEKEVTLAEDGTAKVAGIVTTNPAYVMNQCCKGFAVAIALQGRVPAKVRGTIRKGDMMISGGNGFARPCLAPQMGTVIGKALENFDGIEGTIEIAVGRL